MFRSLFASLRFRVSLLIVVALVPAVVLNVYNTVQQRRWAAEEMQQDAMRLVRVVADRQVQLTQGAQELLSSLTLVPAIRDADPVQCSALLASVLERFPHYTSLSVVTPAGDLVCRGLRPGAMATVEGLAVESAFRRAISTGEFSIGSYAIGTVTRKPVVPFAMPIRDGTGTVRGVLTTTLDLAWIDRFAGVNGLPSGAALNVVDDGGTVLARYPDPERWAGVHLPEATELRRLVSEHGGTEGVFRAAGLDSVLRFYAFSRFPAAEGAPVMVSLGIPEAKAFAPANRNLTRDLGILFLLGGTTVLLGWVVGTRTIVRPVRSLLAATSRLAAGDLTARASGVGRDGELGALSLSFDEMAEALQQRTTETAASIAALRRSEERYRSLVEATAAFVWTTPSSGEFEGPQPRWSDFTGQTSEELRGWGWIEAVHPDDRARIAQAWSVATETGHLYQVEKRLRRHDGEFRYMMVRAVPIVGENGEVREWIGVHTDITERKRAEIERAALLARAQEARAEAEAANRAKSDFLAVISHELRTPLTSIISYAELMELDPRSCLSDRQREYVARIDASAWHLKELVDQVLEFARLEAGRISLDVSPADVVEVVRDCVSDILPMAQLKGLTVEVTAPPLPVVVETDATKVRQIVLNLLSNAVKFSDEGAIHAEVLADAAGVRIRVHDRGPGIHPEHLPRIWERFWQAEDPLTRRAGGTGLGLAIVQRLADLLGGTVGVESRLGEGSTFSLSLPLAAPAARVEAAEEVASRNGVPV